MTRWSLAIGCLPVLAMGCSDPGPGLTAPAVAGNGAAQVAASKPSPAAEQPPFNLEAILRGDGFGLVKFRQERDPTHNIVNLDVWVRGLAANTSYSLQRATDTALDDVCTGTNWLTLGEGSTPHPVVTDATGTARAALWRDLSTLTPGTTFDIYFRLIENGTTPVRVAMQSDCYRFVVRE
jgi:hypothetical protein